MIPNNLPEDLQAERAVLTACTTTDCSETITKLTETDFSHPHHKLIFRGILSLLKEKIEINHITLKDSLQRNGTLTKIGGYEEFQKIVSEPIVVNTTSLVDILVRKRKLRELMRIGSKLITDSAQEIQPDTILEGLSQELFVLAQTKETESLEQIGDIAENSISLLFDKLSGKRSFGIRTGFPQLDTLTQGFQAGNLVILAARPAVGKTSYALNMLLNGAISSNRSHGALFSLEMSKEEIFQRLLSTKSRINFRRVGSRDFDFRLQNRILQEKTDLSKLPIFVNDQADLTTKDMEIVLDKHLTTPNNKLDLVVVDYLQLISSGKSNSKDSEATRIGEITRDLKILAKKYALPVVLLSQLNREIEHRQNGTPQLSDLRSSGCIEQDADLVMFLHRPTREEEGLRDLIIAKQRNGPTGKIKLNFDMNLVRFTELDEGDEFGNV